MPSDNSPRRIAVILGPGGASRELMNQLQPLLATDRDIEMQGVFLEEADVQRAAELPFVQELCRVTFAVREFDNDKFEHALALRVRTARRALAVLAERAGVHHTFRNVRGSAVTMLGEAVSESDITVFEPARLRVAAAIAPPPGTRRRRIAALITDRESASEVLRVAVSLAEEDTRKISVMLAPGKGVETDDLLDCSRGLLPGMPASVRLIGPGDKDRLALTLRELLATILIAPATDEMINEKMLRFFRERVRCPVCLVRRVDP
ncbi:MAG: hypothetical protein V2I48_05020 [Xanthomonadales bacterium]|nr:hypothetical protein [Xanthomonadales bacterium]